jgi:flavin reductase (DIM6/NTAB) family NADH-FMN oxidoreductase RutF
MPVTERFATSTVEFDEISPYQRYKLMASLIVPRPIALITTIGTGGVVNAAPFSMFAMVGEDPPLLMVSINRADNERRKDTAVNIDATGEFVVHITDEPIAERMHRCGEAVPPWRSEPEMVGFTVVDDTTIGPPRIAEAPVAFECRLHERIDIDSRHVYFGRILRLHSRDGLIDTVRWRVRLQTYQPVGRFGASFYLTSRDRFTLSGERSGDIDEI